MTDPPGSTTPADDEMAAVIAAHDWSSSGLGPPEKWPPSTAVVSVSGEIDLSNIDRFRAALDMEVPTLIVDLAGVTYIDSAGMAVLFSRAARGSLEVRCRPTSVVSPLIDITRLCDVAVVRRSG